MNPSDDQIGDLLADSAEALPPTRTARVAIHANLFAQSNYEPILARKRQSRQSFWIVGGLAAVAVICLFVGFALFLIMMGPDAELPAKLLNQTAVKPSPIDEHDTSPDDTFIETPEIYPPDEQRETQFDDETSPEVRVVAEVPDLPNDFSRQDVGGSGAGTGGVVRVMVVFEGKYRPPMVLRMDADPNCVAHWAGNKKRPVNERLVINEDKTVQNVVLFLSGDGTQGRWEPPVDPFLLEQQGCMYTPHLVAVMSDRDVIIHNRDSTLHNVSFLPASGSDNPAFNIAQPVKGMKHRVTFNHPELGGSFQCQVHTWMNAWLCVFDHPFFAVTNELGAVEIHGVPVGEYELAAWHEDPKFRQSLKPQIIEVKEGEATEIVLTVSR